MNDKVPAPCNLMGSAIIFILTSMVRDSDEGDPCDAL
jgi:hypothetical protein